MIFLKIGIGIKNWTRIIGRHFLVAYIEISAINIFKNLVQISL